MTNFNRYQDSNSETAVMCDSHGDGNRTYVLREADFPVPSWLITHLMNDAFKQGYRAAQSDIRAALGVKI